MEFSIDRGDLVEAVAQAARALPSRTPVPVLGGLLLDAADGRLSVSGYDFETAARIETDAEVGRGGRVLVLGRRLLDICKVLPDGQVSCSLEGTRFTVEAGGTGFGLSTLPQEEYPAPPAPPKAYGTVDAAAFATAVAQVAVAAGRDETLPVLTGVQLRLEGEEMTLAASDRYRYAVRRLAWSPQPGADAAGVVETLAPARRLLDVARSLARCSLVRIGLDGSSGRGPIGFEGGRTRTVVRPLEGRLPSYGKLFDMADAAVAEVGCGPLTEAVRRVAVVADADSPVRLDFSADSVLVRAGHGDDVAAQRVPAALTGAREITVAFSPAYLLDALASFETPALRVALLGAGQRALLSAADGPQIHRHLLMSVRQLV
ncbi:DNA polymerase III subunit beta [Streptomyces sp. B21-097]|uniref:DNA polymerase III subunit beta n=1 Tax=Streptomyces TaxID=1883 RepID=UPI002FF074E9